jgi:hypothetical protein
MSYDPDFEYKDNKHFRTRATGQLWMGPMKQIGYDNRVIQVIANELEFDNSVEARRFMDYQRKKYVSPTKLCQSRKLKMISRNDN